MTLHFIRPYWLWMLLPASFYVIGIIRSFRPRNPWLTVCDAHLLPALLQSNRQHSRHWFYCALLLFYLIAIIALAGPTWQKTSVPIYRPVRTMSLVLDLSPAMNETDLKPNRLTRAKYKIRDLIHASPNTQMSLTVFTGVAFMASPLSQDANTLLALLDELNLNMMPVGGSDSGQGLMEGYQLLKQAGFAHGEILLITASKPTAGSWDAAKRIAQNGAYLNILAMLENTPSNKAVIQDLQQLAHIGHGKLYQFTSDETDILNITQDGGAKEVVREEKHDNSSVWLDAGPWFSLGLIPIVLWILRERRRYEKT